MSKESNLIAQIKYVVDHNVKVMGEIVGDSTQNLYASGILEAYTQMQKTINRLEEAQSDSNKA